MTATASPTAADIATLAEGLRPALLRLSRQLRKESQRFGISPLDAMLLGWVKRREGIGVSELADLEQMSRPTMSSHVKRLEQAGWISRQAPDSEDKRRVGLVITAAGRRAIDAVRRQRNDWLAGRLASLTPEARDALRAAVGPLSQIAGEKA
ncbi:MAG TPA: MarR family transcriptional regulator [Caulobacteraceae bacterium]|jgi:DNA-binding MarR family transcriptional regulator|nr:MarR family transcriptional regulator [Caulobacteraceae bacterium]